MMSSKRFYADWLRRRAAILRQLRSFFDDRGFCEVQPECLGRDCVVDAFIDPIRVPLMELGIVEWGDAEASKTESDKTASDDHPDAFRYLQTSPESAMKQMLVDGAPSIYAITPVFRRGEVGPLHRLEFTMLEWYELDGNTASALKLLDGLSQGMMACRARRTTYRELFIEYAGFDPFDARTVTIADVVARIDPTLAQSTSDDRDGLLDIVLSEVIQPALRDEPSLLVTHYPASQAALAKICDDQPHCAERFEWFVRGIELANGYDELIDADELEHRFREAHRKRAARGGFALPKRTDLLAAMRCGLPACSGVALGVDRLQMCADNDAALE